MNDSTGQMTVQVWRGRGDDGDFASYEVPRRDSQTVLDVVSWVQQYADPSLSYRFACRVGMCGSCAMMVNGRPRWTCRTHVDKVAENGRLEIAPLRNLPVVKDLVVDMAPFFDKWIEAEGVFHPSATREDEIPRIDPESELRLSADQATECINCAVCYAACDVVSSNPDYLGPAALNRAWSLVNDEKDGARAARLDAVSGPGGCHNCHSHQSCVEYCPSELVPTASIAGLKRETTRRLLGLGKR